MEISINNQVKELVNEEQIKELVDFFVSSFSLSTSSLSIAFVDKQTMTALNKTARDKEGTTDILSFEGEDMFLGELILDLDYIKNQKPIYDKNFDNELLFIIAHGLLHLIGFTDDKEEGRQDMIRRGTEIIEKYLKKISITK